MSEQEPPSWVTEGIEPEERAIIPPPNTDADALYRYSNTFYVARWESKNGHDRKRFSPFCWDGRQWVAKQLIPAGQRPLFQPDNTGSAASLFLIVEGEKTAISAAKLVDPRTRVITWSGGSAGVGATDWGPLLTTPITIWPDNDKPGIDAARAIQAKLPQAKIVDLPFDFPDGWDLADPLPEGYTPAWVQSQIGGARGAQIEEPAAPERGTRVGILTLLTDTDAFNSTPRDYYIKGLISPAEMSVIYGVPGCGKSFFALYIARAVAQGREILGRRIHQTNVLFLALEGIAGFENRLKAQINAYSQAPGFGYIAQSVNLFDDNKAKESVIQAAQVMKAGLIVIDTLNRALAGGSENDPADMGQFIQNIDAIRAATDAHILVIHHAGKDQARGMRGHSSLLGAADVAIEVKKNDNAPHSATVEKAKDDADGALFNFQLITADLGVDEDGDQKTTCLVEEVEAAKPKLGAKLTDDERDWLGNIQQYFLHSSTLVITRPMREMSVAIPCATRDEIRGWLATRGLIGVAERVAKDATLNSTDRSKLSRMLNTLRKKQKIGIYEDWIWLI